MLCVEKCEPGAETIPDSSVPDQDHDASLGLQHTGHCTCCHRLSCALWLGARGEVRWGGVGWGDSLGRWTEVTSPYVWTITDVAVDVQVCFLQTELNNRLIL